mgnify:CR=1 FL=1
MSTTATATMNGRPQRKQLGDQLDRLDSIIDALAEGLPGAVADACRDGARLAVKDAIIEIISNPELRALLTPRPEPVKEVVAPLEIKPEEPRKPGLWSRLKAKVAAAREAVVGSVQKAKDAVKSRCAVASGIMTAIGTMAGEAIPVRRILLVGIVIGLAVGLLTLVLPDTAAAAISAVSTTISVISMQVGGWLKRAAARFGLVM